MTTTMRVSPVSTHQLREEDEHVHARHVYELHPMAPLPSVDLSISVESRFLSRAALNCMQRVLFQRRIVTLASWFAFIAYFGSLAAPASYGRVLGVVCFALWLPTVLISALLLRYEILVHLFRSFDVWFCTCINASTFVVLGLLLCDTRALALLTSWSGIQLNIVIDANIRGVKMWSILNTLGIINSAVTWSVLMFDRIEDMHDFHLIAYKHHALPASAYVASGLVTVTALVARNVFRKRHVFRKRTTKRSVIECVSYQVDLHYVRTSVVDNRVGATRSPSRLRALPTLSVLLPPNNADRPESEKTLMYRKRLTLLDAQYTVWPCVRVEWPITVSQHRQARAIAALGVVALAASISGVFIDVYVLAPTATACAAQVAALVLSVTYCSLCALHWQRHVLRELLATFDVLFLAAQLFMTIAGAYALLALTLDRGSVTALVTAIWCVWVLGLDAAPPVVRAQLALRRGFVLCVLLALLGAAAGVLYLLVFADDRASGSNNGFDTTTVDRDIVLWHSVVFGRDVQLRLAPIFYNSLATALVLVLRLVWRAGAIDRSEHDTRNRTDPSDKLSPSTPSSPLLLLTGAVVYENYLSTARQRQSRRWGSLAARRAKPVESAKVLQQQPVDERSNSKRQPKCSNHRQHQ